MASISTLKASATKTPASANTIKKPSGPPDLTIRCESTLFAVHHDFVSHTALFKGVQYNGIQDGIPQVEILNIKPDVLACVLDFIYTGDFDETGEKSYIREASAARTACAPVLPSTIVSSPGDAPAAGSSQAVEQVARIKSVDPSQPRRGGKDPAADTADIKKSAATRPFDNTFLTGEALQEMIEHVKELGLDYDHADCKRFLEEIRDRENEAGEQLSLSSMFPTTPLAMDSNDFNNAMLADLNKRRAAEEVVEYKNGVDHREKKGQATSGSSSVSASTPKPRPPPPSPEEGFQGYESDEEPRRASRLLSGRGGLSERYHTSDIQPPYLPTRTTGPIVHSSGSPARAVPPSAITAKGKSLSENTPLSPSAARHRRLVSLYTHAQQLRLPELMSLVEAKFASNGNLTAYLDEVRSNSAQNSPSEHHSSLASRLVEVKVTDPGSKKEHVLKFPSPKAIRGEDRERAIGRYNGGGDLAASTLSAKGSFYSAEEDTFEKGEDGNKKVATADNGKGKAKIEDSVSGLVDAGKEYKLYTTTSRVDASQRRLRGVTTARLSIGDQFRAIPIDTKSPLVQKQLFCLAGPSGKQEEDTDDDGVLIPTAAEAETQTDLGASVMSLNSSSQTNEDDAPEIITMEDSKPKFATSKVYKSSVHQPQDFVNIPSGADMENQLNQLESAIGEQTKLLDDKHKLIAEQMKLVEDKQKLLDEQKLKILSLQQEKFQAELARDSAQGRLDGLIKVLNDTKRCKNNGCLVSMNVAVNESEVRLRGNVTIRCGCCGARQK